MKRPTIEQAQAWLTDRVMEWPGIAGTTIGECGGEPCIKVLVQSPSDDLRERIPEQFEWYAVQMQVAGKTRTLDQG
jgi:hypothetical protein